MKKEVVKYERKLIDLGKFLLLVVVCFLPSFIFTTLFVQYGSPFVNYFKFISNFESSWLGWLSAVGILILFFISKGIVKSSKNFSLVKNRIESFFLIICFIAVLFLITIQSYLYVSFLLGNDILVKLSASNDNFFFNDKFDKNVTFKISVTSAPFCSAQCDYSFFDLSTGTEIEKGEFNLTTAFSKSKQYNITNNNLIFGTQVIKRFEVSCKNKKALFCRTNEKESKRTVLVTVNYNISEENYHLSPSCCFMGKCEDCCYYHCSEKNYPVIFIHGHSIDKTLPADYSLDVFTEMKQKLVSEGNYFDAGAVVINPTTEVNGLLGKVNATMLVTASYFFDTYKTSKGEITNSSTIENISTYAERLNRIVKIVKERTGKDKVILVTISMGGLVARDYIKLFGKNDVDKMILISAPNHGVDDKIRDYCYVFGSSQTCSDMNENSTFIKNLNDDPREIVPTYNIIGIGCNMSDETGDGFIKNSSQYLSYANNYYISGTCNEAVFNYLHGDIIFPDRTPEAYNLVKKILANQKL
jgi:hypothetical protein